MLYDEARLAVAKLMEPFAEFPFVDDASRAHFLAMVIEPFVRMTIGHEHPTPLYVVHASQPGTGKGLLIKCGLYIANGAVAAQTYHRDDASSTSG